MDEDIDLPKEKSIHFEYTIPCIRKVIKQLEGYIEELGEYKKQFQNKKFRCKRCNTNMVVYRVITNDFKCRNCGMKSELEDL